MHARVSIRAGWFAKEPEMFVWRQGWDARAANCGWDGCVVKHGGKGIHEVSNGLSKMIRVLCRRVERQSCI